MGETVQNLGLSLLAQGISLDEANHEGVCVQELPVSERSCDPMDSLKPYVPYKEYNISKCIAIELLRTCFHSGSDTLYGTLSHSHLFLAMRCMITGAPWAWPPKWKGVFGRGLYSGPSTWPQLRPKTQASRRCLHRASPWRC